MTGIYRYTNKINGKRYIGQAIDIDTRHKRHIGNANSEKPLCLLDKAIKKYGIDNFIFEVLEYCEPKELNKLEVEWISYYNTNIYKNGYGYNRNDGGDGHGGISSNKGKHLSEETKKKISEAHKGKKLSPEHIYKITRHLKPNTYGMLGKHQTEYQKQVASKINKGKIISEETRQKLKQAKENVSWYHLGENNILIKPDKIEYYESLGYTKGRYMPKNNNSWYHLGENNVFIKPDKIEYYESLGYIKGRYIKK